MNPTGQQNYSADVGTGEMKDQGWVMSAATTH